MEFTLHNNNDEYSLLIQFLPTQPICFSFEGKRVDISILDLALAGMGLSLTPTELQEALKLTVSNSECVSLFSL